MAKIGIFALTNAIFVPSHGSVPPAIVKCVSDPNYFFYVWMYASGEHMKYSVLEFIAVPR